MCGLIKKMFMKLITSIGSASGHTKSASLSNQKYMTQPTLTNLYPNEYSQELHYHPFEVNFNRYVRSCNTLNDLSNRVYISNKSEDLDLSVLNTNRRINELKTLTKHISWECKCKFGSRRCNLNQK